MVIDNDMDTVVAVIVGGTVVGSLIIVVLIIVFVGWILVKLKKQKPISNIGKLSLLHTLFPSIQLLMIYL